jgi:hypothetical protein
MKFDGDWALETALTAMTTADWAVDAEQVMWQSLASPDALPLLASCWARYCCASGHFRLRKKLNQLVDYDKLGAEALTGYMEGLRQAGKADWLKRSVSYYRGWLRASTELWGAAGYALVSVGEYGTATKWFADWKKRSDLQPWMLLNHSVALRALKHDAEARDVSEFAIALPKSDHTTSSHLIWLAVDDALANEPDAAKARLAAVGAREEADYYRLLESLVECWLKLRQSPAENWHAEFDSARQHMKKAVNDYREKGHAIDLMLRRVFRRLAWRMARMQGNLIVGLWRYVTMIA